MCGGQSRRMGTDKGLIPINNTCWAAFVGSKLAAIPLMVSASINQNQQQQYQSFFLPDQLIVDSLNIGGPLNGLLSVHARYPDDDLFLLACDMISMEAKTLDRLISIYKNEPGYDFYAYQNVGFAETLCAIYTGNGLNKLLAGHDLPSLENSSLQRALNEGKTKRLPISEPLSFTNNNHKNLNGDV